MDITTQIAQITGATAGMLEEGRKEHANFEALASELNSRFGRIDAELAAIEQDFAQVLQDAANEEKLDAEAGESTPTAG